MPAWVWRLLAVTGAAVALCFVIVDSADLASYTDPHVAVEPADGHTMARLRVTSVSGTPAENGGLQAGDIVTPAGGFTLRMRLGAERPGAIDTWIVQRPGRPPFRTQTQVAQETGKDLALDEIFNIVRFAMLVVAIVVAVRAPELPAARALVTFLILIALTLMPGGVWLPDPALAAWRVLRGPIQCLSLAQGVRFACIFPFVSPGGARRRLERINPWYTLIAVSLTFGLGAWTRVTGTLPDIGFWRGVIEVLPIGYIPALVPAFVIAGMQARGRDRVRVYWAAGSICLGFLGPLIQVVLFLAFHRNDDLVGFLPLTLVAIPLGLAYTILRHRTVDIGFVISRALVLTILSFTIVAAFGLLERALGKIFIDASHVASRTVEIALALGLGFSLRSLHTRIEQLVDRFFFRARRRALAALRDFAEDVYFITDPNVAIGRTVDVAGRCTDAEQAALYLSAGGVFERAAASDEAALPARIDMDDALLVRLRATRKTALLHGLGSSIGAEVAFPMFVRGTLVGALALAPKRSGEAYDPEETALLADLVQRVGLALDALQTLALRRELDLPAAAR